MYVCLLKSRGEAVNYYEKESKGLGKRFVSHEQKLQEFQS